MGVGFGVRDQGLGFGVQGLGSRVQGSGVIFRVQGLRFRLYKVQGSAFPGYVGMKWVRGMNCGVHGIKRGMGKDTETTKLSYRKEPLLAATCPHSGNLGEVLMSCSISFSSSFSTV